MENWLKGGLIGLIVSVIFIILIFTIQEFGELPIIYHLFIFGIIQCSIIIQCVGECWKCVFYGSVIDVIEFAILGAIIGLIIGKINQKKKNESINSNR